MWLSYVLIAMLIGILWYFNVKKPHNYPPGPSWIPILGCAIQIQRYRKKAGTLAMATNQMAKDYTNGHIVGLRVGSELQVIVNSFEGYKEFASNPILDGRPTGPLYTLKSWGLSRGILVVDGDLWQEQRRFLVRHLSTFGFGKSSSEAVIIKEVTSLIELFKSEINKSPNGYATIPFHNAFGISMLNLIWYMLAGVQYEPNDIEVQTIQNIMDDLFASMDRTGTIFHHFPILRYIAPEASGYARYMRALKKGWDFLDVALTHHKNTMQPGVQRDFMDVFLTEMESRGTEQSSFSEKQLVALCMDMFMAASHTSSKSLSFGFLHFLRHPDVYKKAQEQIDRVVGRERLPTLDDKPNLPYIDACACESVRVFSGHGLSIPHRALEDTTLLGYFIPKNTTVVFNHNGLQMNDQLWDDPWTFKPERFLDVDGKLSIPPFFQAFGLGRHHCIGYTLARSSLFLFISHILHTFNIRNPEGAPLPDPFPVEGIFTNTQPYEAEISLRLN